MSQQLFVPRVLNKLKSQGPLITKLPNLSTDLRRQMRAEHTRTPSFLSVQMETQWQSLRLCPLIMVNHRG
jgi:hypothetical protein